MKIAIVIAYFGKWPDWMNLYMYSVSKNPQLDIIYYTDCPIPENAPANIIFHTISFEEYKAYASWKLGVDLSKVKVYKLCDLKAFYGFLHKEELEKYDFWGFGDNDLCYGDLSQLLSQDNLTKYDVITTQRYFLAGHFTIFRNTAHYRNLCFQVRNWKQLLLEERTIAFEEHYVSDLIFPYRLTVIRLHKYFFKYLGIPRYKIQKWLVGKMSPRLYMQELRTSLAPWPGAKDDWMKPDIDRRVWTYYPSSGKMIDYRGIELPYLHFIFFKQRPDKELRIWDSGYYQIATPVGQYEHIAIDSEGIKGLKK